MNNQLSNKMNPISRFPSRFHKAGFGLLSTSLKTLIPLARTFRMNGSVSINAPDNEEPIGKRVKLDQEVGTSNPQDGITDLGKFKFVRTLTDYGERKVTCVEGTIAEKPGKAVLWLEKTPFSEDRIKALCTERSVLKKEFLNDIYGSYSCQVDPSLNEIKASLTYPATDQHIAKFLQKPSHIIYETPELYETVTLPHLEKEKIGHQWVYNVLDGSKEADRVIYNDPDPNVGFVLLPDLKWNAKQNEDLYVLALIRPHGIKSLRDLNETHLPLLKNMLNTVPKVIQDKYKLLASQIRSYIHYQPTFYHLHVHFNCLKYDAPGTKCDKSHMLSTVINNIELMSDYYKQATLPFVIHEGQNLAMEYSSRGVISRVSDTAEIPANS